MKLKAFVTPNPASTFSMLHITNAKGKAELTLLDVQGKFLWKSNGVTGSNILIPLDLYANGVYFIKVTDAKESVIISIVKE